MTTVKQVIATTRTFEIFMAGDLAQAKQACREFCFDNGFCVTITPTDFIYTGGEESGFKVGIINYPRFPCSERELREKAFALGDLLMRRLCQHSYTVVGPNDTDWFSRRPS